ncbi:MAG: Gfo/Idh/MocA family oxidoreductase [Solobacterium sp.]|nr:Gfo/Idh/MocA family oxidoreductase [Solobacterium sp.]
MKKTIVGVIGSGAISGIYLTNMTSRFANLTVKGIASRNFENAKKKAEEFGIRAYRSTEELLADNDIELVVVLVPVGAHYELIRQALLAGKNVYTEKTITETAAQAEELCRIAEEKGLYLGSAPDTFLGTGFQTARKAVDDGMIGEIHSFSISITRKNDFLTAMFPFLRMSGAGALRDYLVYYLTALVSILGPVKKVYAVLKAPYPKRKNEVPETNGYGEFIDTPNEAVIAAAVELQNGIAGTIHEDNESVAFDRADFVLCGRDGILKLGNPNHFGDPVELQKSDGWHRSEPVVLDPVGSYSDNSRGIGPAELADAMQNGRKNRTDKYMALHVLKVIEAMEKSAAEGIAVEIDSAFEQPALFEESFDAE